MLLITVFFPKLQPVEGTAAEIMRPGAGVFHTWRHHYCFSIRTRCTSSRKTPGWGKKKKIKKQWNSASSV